MIRRLIDLWIGRHAEPSLAALQAIEGLRPITVVTGGSRGIGFAIARRFARAGCDVVLIARHADALALAADAIARQHKVKALSIALDVTDARTMQRIDAELRRRRLLPGNARQLRRHRPFRAVRRPHARVDRRAARVERCGPDAPHAGGAPRHAGARARRHHQCRVARRAYSRSQPGRLLCQQGVCRLADPRPSPPRSPDAA
ncbi:MAG: SDR family NAD(P)-dependent oxidoreductase [Hyphomicrobium sp.]